MAANVTFVAAPAIRRGFYRSADRRAGVGGFLAAASYSGISACYGDRKSACKLTRLPVTVAMRL